MAKKLQRKVNILNGGEPVMEKNSLPVSSTPPKVRSRATSESNDESTKPQIRVLEAKLQLSNNEIRNINLEKEKLQEANWYANERVAKLEKKISYLKETTEELSINNSGITQLIAEKDKRMSEMEEEKSKLEWRIGELNQWWNDAKWKIGELESEVAHQRHLLEKANDKIQNLNEQLVSSFRSSSLSNSSVYSVKQPCLGQWQLASGCISSVPSPTISSIFPVVQPVISTKRVVLGIESSPSTDIFVMGSFLNWQCALRCEYLSNGRKGVSLDLPKGRHEFLFFVNNKWVTSPFYSTVPNVYGGQNNIICIE